MRLAERWDRWKRRRFGQYRVEDPRPIAESAPYTFFLPSENELLAVAPGDLVKLTLVGLPGGHNYEAERMWVKVTGVADDDLTGSLENEPFELHQLRIGDSIRFNRFQVIDIIWSQDRTQAPPSAPPHKEYWDRCLVDRCVVDEAVPVYYLYREEPDMSEPEDKYPDSGWRIRGDYRGLSDDVLEGWDQEYIALGKVLNADDSWLHLIEAPIGSAYIRNTDTGEFIACEGE
jgi:hypothetical protein